MSADRIVEIMCLNFHYMHAGEETCSACGEPRIVTTQMPAPTSPAVPSGERDDALEHVEELLKQWDARAFETGGAMEATYLRCREQLDCALGPLRAALRAAQPRPFAPPDTYIMPGETIAGAVTRREHEIRAAQPGEGLLEMARHAGYQEGWDAAKAEVALFTTAGAAPSPTIGPLPFVQVGPNATGTNMPSQTDASTEARRIEGTALDRKNEDGSRMGYIFYEGSMGTNGQPWERATLLIYDAPPPASEPVE